MKFTIETKSFGTWKIISSGDAAPETISAQFLQMLLSNTVDEEFRLTINKNNFMGGKDGG